MPTQRKLCSAPGCDGTVVNEHRCARHMRGTSSQRGYGHTHRIRFRGAVLKRDPVCVICWIAPATVADHYPTSRRNLVAAGLDPDDPQYGRGLCATCDHRQTGHRQPGGWNLT